MKKFLTLILGGLMALSFGSLAACDMPLGGDGEGNSGETIKGVEITEDQWELAIADVTFDNVSFTQVGDSTLTQNGVTLNIKEDIWVKIADDELVFGGKVTNKATGQISETAEQKYTGSQASAYRTTYTKIFMSVLAQNDKFVYNAELGAYELSEKVVVEQSTSIQTVREEITNGKAVFNEQGYLVSFSCHLYETDVRNGETVTIYDTNITWTFSAYGTTVINPEAENNA